jgi:subtilisin family serine protease/PKD repeat protein
MRNKIGKLALKNFFMLLMIFTAQILYAQDWKKKTNTSYLIRLSEDLNKIYEDYRTAVETYAFERDILIREVMDNGRTVSLVRIMPSGLPEFYMTHNLKAAQNVGTTRLRPKADLSLNLTGKNILVGVWDSGSTNVEHQEFGDRVEIKDNIPFDDHGTHVAGTIAAAGVNPQAKGMAYETQIIAYEFNNDNSEMAEEAADGLIISNHSYGLRTGWDVNSAGTGWQWFGDPSVSNVEDYRFGYYDASNSRVWDDISFNAPYYLIVKSAGNDRTDIGDGTRPPDGPYDCLEPKSVAKNVLTIGAVEHIDGDYTGPEDVVMSEFSSWGPTDDGRIKPDLSAIGVDVFSALSGGVDVYGTLSGTSMSAPNTTGSLALLQEYYAQLYSGNYMLSATLKALAIHTVNEAGANPGPDYEYGWGLLAVDKAANIITRNDGKDFIIDELNLLQNDSIVVKVASDGTQPLVATICWTDVPGNPAPIGLNPQNLMLINDLDMRIYDEDENAYLPWILDPAAPDEGATFGDNFRDNVEKIEIAAPTAGEYTIVIKHKNNLRNGNQDFSLIVSTASVDLNLQTFYWIGGSGDWNNPANWSLSSGGNVANAIPAINNPVVFDNNSFPDNVSTINLTSQANCYNINYYTTDSCVINLSAFTLNIDGSVFDENKKLSLNNGSIVFSGLNSKNNQVLLAESAFRDIDLRFISTNGSWSISQGFTAKSLTIENSSLFATNKQLNINAISATSTSQNTIDFSGSKISDVNIVNVANAPNILFNTSTVIMSNDNGVNNKSINGAGNVFHNIQLENASLTINGNNSFNRLQVNGTITLTGSNSIDSLSLSGSSSATFSENSTQTLNKAFQATGSGGSLISISSSGAANANLFADDSNIRFCLDFLDVNNISVSGRTGFLSGDNSTINANSTGWIELDCDDALFPSFEVEFPCAMGETRFVDTSTGFPTEWNWDFGNLQFPTENTSSQRNPFHNFRFEGDYTVTFNVKNSQFDEMITRTISVIDYESGLGVPSINVNGTRLTSSVIAPSYQWYLNNNPISGATERVFEISNQGTYHVTVADENCLFRSEATVVTSLEDQLNATGLKVYPNPSKGVFTLELTNKQKGQVEVIIHDLIGNTLQSGIYIKSGDLLKEQMDLNRLPNGIYHMLVHINNKQFIKKIVVAN